MAFKASFESHSAPALSGRWCKSSPSSWAVVKAEGRPSSSITEQLLFGSHMVPTSAMPRVSQVEAPQRSCTKNKPQKQLWIKCAKMFCLIKFLRHRTSDSLYHSSITEMFETPVRSLPSSFALHQATTVNHLPPSNLIHYIHFCHTN